jgi:hypothetical protein
MLNELEGKLTSVVADAVATRAGLHVVEAGGPLGEPADGEGVVRVALTQVEPEAGFEPELRAFGNGGGLPRSRRVLPVRFAAALQFARRPMGTGEANATAARRLLLEDMSLVGHALGDGQVRTGAAFATAGDPGFEVRAFELATGTVAGEPADGLLRGELVCKGKVIIWPSGVAAEEGEISAVDALAAALPLTILADDPVVEVGGSTNVRIRGAAGRRLTDVETGARAPQRLAVGVASDLPPAQRGTITSGDPGAQAGFRIVETAEPETVVGYQAPAGDIGAITSERIAVHLAGAGGATGLPLGVTVIALRPGGP